MIMQFLEVADAVETASTEPGAKPGRAEEAASRQPGWA